MQGWAFKLVRVWGIWVYVHWTFLLLLAVIAGSELLASGTVPMPQRLAAAGMATLFIICVFGCVVLHEFGHAMAARAYGIRTKDIYILPIGGVARLESVPRSPLIEFVVTIAGPAVNVVIAVILALVLGIGAVLDTATGAASGASGASGGAGAVPPSLLSSSLLEKLLFANIALVIFNLIPAFPMDGGRLLRAILAAMMPYERATLIAVRVGQAVAVLMAVGAFFAGMPLLLFVAVFVFAGARAELATARVLGRLDGLRVADAIEHRFVVLREHDAIDSIAQMFQNGQQSDFPVVRDDQSLYDPDHTRSFTPSLLVGMISAQQVAQLLAPEHAPAAATPAGSIMQTDFAIVRETDSLESAIQRMQTNALHAIPVVVDGGPNLRLIGLLTRFSISQILDARALQPRRNR